MESKTQSNEPKKHIKYWQSVALVAALIPTIFWLRFGRVDGFAVAFTAFLILLMTAVQFLPGLGSKYENDAPRKYVSSSKFDRLGVVWLLSIPFAPFLSWMINEYFTTTPDNWRTILTVKAGLCVLLPCICVLPLIRYINGKTALVATLILVIGTCFPVIIGWNSMLDIIQGPQERTVVVSDVHGIYYTRNFKNIPTDIIEITLDDGKVFQANIKYVSVKSGVQTLVMLEHVGVVIEAK
ncbi:MAG: hypothetical protein WDO15_03820 [Bacteroidota bacterium]